jgi:hypothetical protein
LLTRILAIYFNIAVISRHAQERIKKSKLHGSGRDALHRRNAFIVKILFYYCPSPFLCARIPARRNPAPRPQENSPTAQPRKLYSLTFQALHGKKILVSMPATLDHSNQDFLIKSPYNYPHNSIYILGFYF